LTAIGACEAVVPVAELDAARRQIRELQRLLARTTLEAEILKEAMEVASAAATHWAARRHAPVSTRARPEAADDCHSEPAVERHGGSVRASNCDSCLPIPGILS
jgi:hypothetical protein